MQTEVGKYDSFSFNHTNYEFNGYYISFSSSREY